jgi:hypothetical protein
VIFFRYNTPLFYDANTEQLSIGSAAVPGMLVRHSVHLLVDRQQQQQQQQHTPSPPPNTRILILMGGAFCFSFGCVFSPCYQMPVPAPLLPQVAPSLRARVTVDVDVLLCPKVGSTFALHVMNTSGIPVVISFGSTTTHPWMLGQ